MRGKRAVKRDLGAKQQVVRLISALSRTSRGNLALPQQRFHVDEVRAVAGSQREAALEVTGSKLYSTGQKSVHIPMRLVSPGNLRRVLRLSIEFALPLLRQSNLPS
jgi:hypothetical protein